MSLDLSSHGFSDVVLLGQGAFGSVYKCTSSTGEARAVKICTGVKERITAEHEAQVMASITPHPNVLPLVSFSSYPSCTIMTLPLATGGDTLKFMQDRGCAPLADSEARHLFGQLVDAVQHVHSSGFVHRDIKCENILLTGVRRRTVLLADFGFATRYARGEKSLTEPWGSIHYSSPEIAAQRAYEGPEVDVWSMGVVLFAWTTGRLPFGGATEQEVIARIITGNYPPPRHLSEQLASLIAALLHVDPTKRITINEIRKHPWMAPLTQSPFANRFVPSSTSYSSIVTLGRVEPAAAPRRSSLAAVEPRRTSLLKSVFQRVFSHNKGAT